MSVSTPPSLLAFLAQDPTRCKSCGWHPAKQGHAGDCGDAERDKAYQQLDSAPNATDENALIRRTIIALGHRKFEFTPDDLPAEVREQTNPNRRGRVFAALVAEGVIREVGRTKSKNPKAHGKSVGVYRLT